MNRSVFHIIIPGEVHLQSGSHLVSLRFLFVPVAPWMHLHSLPYHIDLAFSQAFSDPRWMLFWCQTGPRRLSESFPGFAQPGPHEQALHQTRSLAAAGTSSCSGTRWAWQGLTYSFYHPSRDSTKARRWRNREMNWALGVYFVPTSKHSKKPSRSCSLVLSAGLGLQLRAANSWWQQLSAPIKIRIKALSGKLVWLLLPWCYFKSLLLHYREICERQGLLVQSWAARIRTPAANPLLTKKPPLCRNHVLLLNSLHDYSISF